MSVVKLERERHWPPMRWNRDQNSAFRITAREDVAKPPAGLDADSEFRRTREVGLDASDLWFRRRLTRTRALRRLSIEGSNRNQRDYPDPTAPSSHLWSIASASALLQYRPPPRRTHVPPRLSHGGTGRDVINPACARSSVQLLVGVIHQSVCLTPGVGFKEAACRAGFDWQ